MYAKRVLALLLRSDLCSTEPWMRTRSPDPAALAGTVLGMWGKQTTYQGCTPREYIRPRELILGWDPEAPQIRFLRKASEQNASRWALLDGSQEERRVHHSPECTVPKRSRTQAQRVGRYTGAVLAALIRTERVLGGTQGTYCNITEFY